jgi:paraquat-inducible protein A
MSTSYSPNGLIACRECDRLHRLSPVRGSIRASCSRCGAPLFKLIDNGLNRSLALNLSALMLLIMANSFPLLSLKLGGRIEESLLLSGAWAMFQNGQWELGVLVALTSMVFPLLTISGWLYMLLPLRFGRRPPGMGWVYRWIRHLGPWSLIGVFMLGVLVAMVKLLDLAEVIPGISLFALVGLLFVSSAARANQPSNLIWPLEGPQHTLLHAAPNALAHGFHNCHHCGLLVVDNVNRCPRCGGSMHARKPDSTHRAWALLIAAVILFIPANVYPVMTVIRFGSGEPSTILGGVIHLIESDMIPLAMLVLFASIVVPVLKLLVLGFLLLSIHNRSNWRPRDRTLLFRVTEVVGAWSMVDIYLVAILTALVDLDALATIRPGIGASFFAGVVVLTLFAAHSFDPRLIWDNTSE